MKEKNNSSENNSSYNLSNTDNYLNKLSVNLKDLLDRYNSIVIEYLHLIFEKISIKKINYFNFILIRGLETITHVFIILLYYTKNTSLTYYHTRQAFYFYVEFIEQISVDQNSFLKLTSKDAVMFVYKKTIFEINNDIKKSKKEDTCENKIFFEDLNNYLLTYKHLICFYLQSIQNTNTNTNTNTRIDDCCKTINIWSLYLNNNKLYIKEIKECIILFLEIIESTTENMEYIEMFIKKIVNKKNEKNVYENIKMKIIDITLRKEIDNTTKCILKELFDSN